MIYSVVICFPLLCQSPVDGKPMLLTPEESIQIQVRKLWTLLLHLNIILEGALILVLSLILAF